MVRFKCPYKIKCDYYSCILKYDVIMCYIWNVYLTKYYYYLKDNQNVNCTKSNINAHK